MKDIEWKVRLRKLQRQIHYNEEHKDDRQTIDWGHYTKTNLYVSQNWLRENYPETLTAWQKIEEDKLNEESNEIPSDVKEMINMIIVSAEYNPELRNTACTTIKSLLKPYWSLEA
jgi:hypothetical protein